MLKEEQMKNNKSTFVTVVAWLFIVGSGLATVVSVMQNIVIHFMFKNKGFSQTPDNMPAGASFMIENIQLIMLVFLLVSLMMFVSSVGLLKRKNWARLIFIVLMSIGIVWMIVGIIFQLVFFSSMPEMQQSAEFQDFQAMQSLMMWFTALISIAMAGLFAWIIKRLFSEPIKQEFMAYTV